MMMLFAELNLWIFSDFLGSLHFLLCVGDSGSLESWARCFIYIAMTSDKTHLKPTACSGEYLSFHFFFVGLIKMHQLECNNFMDVIYKGRSHEKE